VLIIPQVVMLGLISTYGIEYKQFQRTRPVGKGGLEQIFPACVPSRRTSASPEPSFWPKSAVSQAGKPTEIQETFRSNAVRAVGARSLLALSRLDDPVRWRMATSAGITLGAQFGGMGCCRGRRRGGEKEHTVSSDEVLVLC
jgi:hypothetical protein